MKKIIFLGLSTCCLWACGSPSVKTSPSSAEFVSVDTLIDMQISLLDSVKPVVNKEIFVDGQTENQRIKYVDWGKELAIFRELDISKAGLQDNYSVTSPAPGVRLYTLKSGKNSVVQHLKIQFASGSSQIARMEGVIAQNNYLYKSEKLLSLDFQTSDQNNVYLANYEIKTTKKILFGDEEIMQIHAKLIE
ncbi:hypothetical protein [Xanthocytophaga agilis]|uniref:Uncharacterized protein n=1 Tax=Xanthocytophaga agilis TaxID=3048010 RepID=A0AAE3R245_9BACT|nr:hypothetical protein [Xanthocytophaga agilis]MDJ1502436.1 hypothetical protein [Xanthocytophaga agilis]